MTQQKRILVLGGTALAVLVILIGRLVIAKMYGHLKSLDEKIANVQSQLTLTQADLNTNKDYVRKWDQVRGFRQEPVEDLQNRATAYLQSLETERRFHFTSLGSPSGRPIEAVPDCQILSYNLNFFANLDDMLEFVLQLDNADRLVRIERLKLIRRSESQSPHDAPVPTFFSWRPGDLSVEMTVAVPARKPTTEIQTSPWENKP